MPLREKSLSPVTFPFFSLVSSSLDKLVQSEIKLESVGMLQFKSITEIVQTISSILSESNDDELTDATNDASIKSILSHTITYVQASESLFNKYLDQFIGWKLCFELKSIGASWFTERVHMYMKSVSIELKYNIAIIHIISSKYEMELCKLGSVHEEPLYKEALCTLTKNQMFMGRIMLQRRHWYLEELQ